jgi:hypothetical protein
LLNLVVLALFSLLVMAVCLHAFIHIVQPSGLLVLLDVQNGTHAGLQFMRQEQAVSDG